MSATTKIEWTDATWNPVRGCVKISPGCKHCYAETFAERFRNVPGHPYQYGFDPRLVPGKLLEPLQWPTPRTVFVNSMSDLFQDAVPDEYIAAVATIMLRANWHTYQVLTKRADRLQQLLTTNLPEAAMAKHIWWGVSVEDQKNGIPRINQLRRTPASLRSIEPLLEDLGTIATKQLLQRDTTTSTELLMTMSMPILHRLAARRRTAQDSPIINRFHALLDDVLGDVPWRDIMHDPNLTSAQKEEHVIAAYCNQLRQYTRYACSCPVRNRDDERVKYYIVFASRHVHALCLMNDIMLNAYQDHTFAQSIDDFPLFADVIDDWRATRTNETHALATIITNTVKQAQRITRAQLWEHIVVQHFMQYRQAEYRQAVQALVHDGTIQSEPPARNGRLNDHTILQPTQKRTPTSVTREPQARRSS